MIIIIHLRSRSVLLVMHIGIQRDSTGRLLGVRRLDAALVSDGVAFVGGALRARLKRRQAAALQGGS
jgi:hypothetical protein